MNRPHKKVIFLSLVLLIFLSFFGHGNSYAQNFSLESANRDRIYFNAIFFKNQIFQLMFFILIQARIL